MRRYLALFAIAALVTRTDAQESRTKKSAATECARLTALNLANVQITTAAAVEPTASERAMGRGTVCRVDGVIGKETGFRALLPDDWNRRFIMGGGGGFGGVIANEAESAANDGYTTVGTDAGHRGHWTTAGWALDNDERKSAYAADAVHQTAVVTKQLIRAYYGAAPEHAYFFGCSNGGREGLMELVQPQHIHVNRFALLPDAWWMPYSATAVETFRGIATKFASGSLAKTTTLIPQLWKRIRELRKK